MKKLFYTMLLATGCVAMQTACDDDSEANVEFAVAAEEVGFQADGGIQQLKLTAGSDWTVSCDADWCMVSPVNGIGSTTCTIRTDSSYSYQSREAHLNFRCGSLSRMVTVCQLGYEKVISLNTDRLVVPDFTDYEEMFKEVKVTSNVKYDVSVEYADAAETGWLKVKRLNAEYNQSIPRDTKVRIDFSMYLSSKADREATVVFRQTDAKEGETPVECRLSFCQTKAQEIIPSREGDSLALLALTRIMHLTENWDTSQPMIYWNNIALQDITYFNEKEQRMVTEPRVVYARFTMFDTDQSIPYHVRYLDQLRELNFTANGNAHLRNIPLSDDVTYLEHLEYLTLMGYGITSLPERMKEMKNLKELDLSGNNFLELPMDIIVALDKHSLRYINFANNRRRDVFANLFANASSRETLGLHGALPKELFQLKNVRYIGLSYNYFEGEVPDLGYDASQYATLEEKVKHNPVMPQLEQLSINLNYLTGELPDWILYHPNLRCWDPYTLVFNQYEHARDSRGHNVGFSNEPAVIEQDCHLWDNEGE